MSSAPQPQSKPRRKLTGKGVSVLGGGFLMFLFGFVFANGALMTFGACALLMLGICLVLACQKPFYLKTGYRWQYSRDFAVG